jgi:hypothetical protein
MPGAPATIFSQRPENLTDREIIMLPRRSVTNFTTVISEKPVLCGGVEKVLAVDASA